MDKEEILIKVIQKEKDSLLELSERNGGNSSEGMSGYLTLAKFYNGGSDNHWSFTPDGERTKKTYNYMYATVENFESMMTDELPMADIPPIDPNDDAEQARAEAAEKLLNKVIEDNNLGTFIGDLSKSMSLYGDGFVFGPYLDKSSKDKKILFSAVENPSSVSIGWTDDKWKNKDWAIIRNRVSLDYANEKWGEYFKSIKSKIKDDATGVTEYWNNIVAPTTVMKWKFVKVVHYWTKDYYAVVVNDQLVDYVEHNWGFIPIHHIPNIKRLGRPWGMSDIEQALDAQVDYNEMTCGEADIIKVVAYPKYVGVNVDEEVKSWRSGITQIFLVGPDADIKALPSGGTPYPVKDYMEGSLQRIYDLTGMTEIAYGRGLASNVSGRAVNVAMQVTVNKLRKKKMRVREMLQELYGNTLKLIEIYFPKAKTIIEGNYKVDIYWNDGLIRNVVDEINKLNAGIQSKYTTMKNLGLASPKDEFKLIENEKITEAEIMAKVQAAMQPPQPQLSEGQNQEGEMPMAQSGTRPGVPSIGAESAARLGGTQ